MFCANLALPNSGPAKFDQLGSSLLSFDKLSGHAHARFDGGISPYPACKAKDSRVAKLATLQPMVDALSQSQKFVFDLPDLGEMGFSREVNQLRLGDGNFLVALRCLHGIPRLIPIIFGVNLRGRFRHFYCVSVYTR